MIRTVIFSVFCLLLAGCKREINLVVEGVEPKLVVEANLNASLDVAYVSITKTIPLNASGSVPVVSDARVSITNLTTGTSRLLPYLPQRSLYATGGFDAKAGDTFLLNVDCGEYQLTARCELMSPVKLDSVTVKTSQFSTPNNLIYDVIPHFTDPSADQRNYYHFRLGVNELYFPKIFVMNNAFTGGKPNLQPLRLRDVELVKGDTVNVIMERVAPVVYQYYYELLQSSRRMGDHPSNPTSNIVGNNSLGYFSAYFTQSGMAEIK